MAPSDDHFGPQIPGVFDFTILFEQSILSLLPTALFIVVAPLRVFPLLSRESRVGPGPLLWAKLTLAAIFAALQVALVALWTTSSTHRTRTSIAEPAIAIVEALAIGIMSYLEHVKSHRPSIILGTYLVFSVILDIALARTFWIRESMDAIAAVFTVSLVTKAALLVLEETPKRAAFVDSKDISRERSAGVISRSVFWWLNRLFWHAARNLITVDDLGPINEKFDSDTLLNTLEARWKNTPKDSPVALFSCTFMTFKKQLAAGILPRLLFSGFSFAQPFLIESVIRFVGSPSDEWSFRVASGLIGATVLIYVGLAISTAWYKHASFQLVTMWRGGLVSLIFKKTLELNPAAVKENAPVTLMTTDMDTIAQSGEVLHDMWGSLIDLPIGIYLLYRQIGYPGLFVLIPTLVTTVVSGAVAPAVEPATIAWNSAVQTRVGHVSEMLGQIKGIKMMGLTNHFHTLLRGLRIKEIVASEKLRWLIVSLTTLVTFAGESTPVIIILAAIYWSLEDGALTIAQAFTSLSIITLSVQPLTLLLASVVQMAGLFGCFMRIQTFLLLEEQKDVRQSSGSQTVKTDLSSQAELAPNRPKSAPGQLNEDVELAALPILDQNLERSAVTLSSVSFAVEDGPQILKDISMSFHRGSLNMVVGRVGCGKSSLLKAIVGELAPQQGTITAIADTMAYCDQTPWLQNVSVRKNITVHSPLDEDWLWTVIHACSLEEDISDFPSGAETLVGSGGVALSGGQKQRLALARAVYARKSIIVIDDVFSGLDNRTSRSVFQALLGPTGLLRQSKTTIIMSTSNTHFLAAADYVTMLEDGSIVRNQITYDSLTPAEWGALEEDEPESSAEPEEEEEEQKRIIRQQSAAGTIERGPTEADMARQTGDVECYKIYLRSVGWQALTISFLLMAGHAGLEIMPQVWLKLWTEDGGSRDARYTAGYVAFVVVSILFGTLDFGFFIIIAIPKSATYLHEKLLTAVCRAPLYFFTSTDSGSILNRFSQDMTLVDQMLPFAFQMTCGLALRAIAQTGLIASGASYAAIGLPFGFFALYLVQKYYLRTSRQMRLLDLEMKTPLYTHFTETLAGVSTIRAFGWSPDFMGDNTRRLDISQKPFYTMFCIQRWLHVVLDLFVAGMALLLVSLALRVLGSTSQGAIGLALINLLSFNMTLKYVIESWTNLETSLGAIARLKWFMSTTPDEHKEGEGRTPGDWPAQGVVEFENVTAAYSDAMSTVLQDISFRIEAGQKVCVCGRSGSGKSSLILSLLRLLELRSGTIRIDGVDLSTLPREHVRTSLTTIPQDPVKITGSVRHNLDPEGKVQSDANYTEVLRKTALWPVIESRGGLDAELSELGFSVGQQQLFSLARALLLRNKIVLLDESTSSVDGVTDREIRRIVTDEMKDRTVIEVLHRLDVVEEFDMVIVMGQGQVLEAGPPRELLAARSELWRLVENKGI